MCASVYTEAFPFIKGTYDSSGTKLSCFSVVPLMLYFCFGSRMESFNAFYLF